MASMIVLYTHPQDTDGFEAHYRDLHMPLIAKVPNVSGATATRITGTPRGEAPYHLAVAIRFTDDAGMGQAMRSEEMMAVSKDAMGLSKQYGTDVTILLGEDF